MPCKRCAAPIVVAGNMRRLWNRKYCESCAREVKRKLDRDRRNKERLIEKIYHDPKLMNIIKNYIVQGGVPFMGCAHERPKRKTLCQLPKGHLGSHQAVIYWEGE